MKSVFAFNALIVTILLFSCTPEKSVEYIHVHPPSIAQEANSVWSTINNIDFFEQQGYTIHLPQHAMIDSMVHKSKEGAFGNEDYATIYGLLEDGLFSIDDYEAAIEKIKEQASALNTMIQHIEDHKSSFDWDFNTFNSYDIILTLYGTGGGYNPDSGIVNLLTNSRGEFMNYENPANTIMHEIVHIGMEQSVVQKHQLPHGIKERLVDLFVKLTFGSQLPEYRVQPMGDESLDEKLKDEKAWQHLDAMLTEYMSHFN